MNGTSNTLIGFQAGYSCVANYNTIIGAWAGYSNTGYHNCFMGKGAGAYSTTGTYNVYLGNYAGKNSGAGNDNVYIGVQAGFNDVGYSNCFFGRDAGIHMTNGNQNVFLGAETQPSTTYTVLTNSIAIGYQATVTHDRNMILGSNSIDVGIGLSGAPSPYNPQAKLEINADPTGNYLYTGAGGSGLKFRQLNSSTGGLTSPVLTVDGTGLVVLTEDKGVTTANNGLTIDPLDAHNVQLGHELGVGSGGDLIHDTEIPMNDKKLLFTDPAAINGFYNSIGIGTSAPGAKVEIRRSLSATKVGAPIGLLVYNSDEPSSPNNSYGIWNLTYGKCRTNYGIGSIVYNGASNYAGYFVAVTSATGTNIGGYFSANNNINTNYAVYATAPRSVDCNFNVAIYGQAPQMVIPPIITPMTGSWAGYFNGDVAAMSYNLIPSDSTIKTNIVKFSGAGQMLKKINCYSYHYDSTKYGDHVNLPKNLQYGFLAQEVKSQFPELVKDGSLPPKIDTTGTVLIQAQPVLMIDYTRMIPLLHEGYREQQDLIDSLTTRLSNLEAIVQSCCGANRNSGSTGQNENQNNNQRNPTAIDVTLSSKTIVLNQNSPNPFKEKTTITYTIPEDAKNTKIIFTDSRGNVLKEIEITQTGDGQLNVYAQDLSSGIYTYSLVINGVTIDTKKMICSK